MSDSHTEPEGERFLDLRGLDPPAPLMRVFEALDAAPDRPLRIRLQREPFPLYPILQAGGWIRRTVTRDDGSVEILISRKA